MSEEQFTERYEEQEFTCPECGSHTFGSGVDDDHQVKGYCHGYKNQVVEGRHATSPPTPCKFTWLRTPAEDAKYFKGTGVFRPREETAQVVSRKEG